ncbi:MAG: hypothetical protein AAB649_05455, partial [Patescibacteria group bacterium]
MVKSKSTVNTDGRRKNKGRPENLKPWPKGKSGNPKGAPKRGESWTEIIKRYGEMTPGEAAQESIELARRFLAIGEGVTLKQAVVLRVYAALLFEPQAGLLNAFMERAEGAVARRLEHSGPDGGPIQYASLTNAELDALILAEAQKLVKPE